MKWFKEWLKRRIQKRYNAGLEYAAAQLLMHGKQAIDQLEGELTRARHFGDFDHFDHGIEFAIECYNARMMDAKVGIE